MWRLMYAMIIVSENGSVAVDSHHTDWPTELRCLQVVEELYSIPPTGKVGGVNLTVAVKAQCVPVREEATRPTAGYTPPPPPQPPRPPYWVR